MKFFFCCLLALKLFIVATPLNLNGKKPNFILFMADDLGYGDISCFGNKTLATPNIDQLASQGVRLTHTVSASAVCTPSRAAFLTGRHPIRYGLVGSHMPVIPYVASKVGLPQSEVTFAKILQQNGYATALIGKWHLGLDCNWQGDKCHHPHTHGFHYFYGIPLSNMRDFGDEKGVYMVVIVYPQMFTYLTSIAVVSFLTAVVMWRRVHRLSSILVGVVGIGLPAFIYFTIVMNKTLNSIIMRNDQVVEQPIVLKSVTRRMVTESMKYIQEQSDNNNPFLLFFSFNHVHVVLDVEDKFKNSGPHGIYGDAVREMDWAVGKVMDMIKDLGLQENTVILFTSDHGAHLGEGGSNQPFSGGKFMFGMEGGVRVPTIISWPGHFPANSVVHAPTTLMDIFPTVLALSGIEAPKHLELDGHDLHQLLAGANSSSPHKFLFHYGAPDDIHAVRYIENDQAVWKVQFKMLKCEFLCVASTLENPLVYNVISDPKESQPLAITSFQYLEILNKVEEAISLHKKQIPMPPSQLSNAALLWRPWLQRCCNFPFCNCQENDTVVS